MNLELQLMTESRALGAPSTEYELLKLEGRVLWIQGSLCVSKDW